MSSNEADPADDGAARIAKLRGQVDMYAQLISSLAAVEREYKMGLTATLVQLSECDPAHPAYVAEGDPHWHVSRHPEDDEQVFAGVFEALKYAAEELERAAAGLIGEAAALADRGEFADAWKRRETSDGYSLVAANAAKVHDKAWAAPWDRAPLYSGPDEAANRAKLRETAAWIVGTVNAEGPTQFTITECTGTDCEPEEV
jgi:hypothetical protein